VLPYDLKEYVVYIAVIDNTAEVGITEVGTPEVGITEVGTPEVGITEVGTAEVGITEVGTPEVGTTEVGTAILHDAIFYRVIITRYDNGTRKPVLDFDFHFISHTYLPTPNIPPAEGL
jgi:glycine cleavage system H lipoate-binding protein